MESFLIHHSYAQGEKDLDREMMAVVIAPVTPATQGADNWKVVV
jgi:hypothetical protein